MIWNDWNVMMEMLEHYGDVRELSGIMRIL